MKSEGDEMKQREEFVMNMCHAQLLTWCLSAMLRALGLNCGHRGLEGVMGSMRGKNDKDSARVKGIQSRVRLQERNQANRVKEKRE